MPKPTRSPPRAARRAGARSAAARPADLAGLRARIEAASLPGPAARAQRGRRLLLIWFDAAAARGVPLREIVKAMAAGQAMRQLGEAARAEVLRAPPREVREADCAAGCAFCCILDGPDGGTITEDEARRVHAALAPVAGRPDGRDWHPSACPALDPATRSCRAYEARPGLCRSYFSTDAEACRTNAAGGIAAGAGLLATHPDTLAAHGIARAALRGIARVPTHALARLAAAAAEGRDVEDALSLSRHAPRVLDATLKGLASAAAAAATPRRPAARGDAPG